MFGLMRRKLIPTADTFVRHFSPLIGRVVKMSGDNAIADDAVCASRNISSSAFIATRLQFAGPVPKAFHHHWVGYRPFIVYLFKRSGPFGKFIHYALHRQYKSIYGFNKSTVVGVVDDKWAQERSIGVEEALAKVFLDMTSWGDTAKLFTYVITLDGEWRFTETGEDFAIDMLSKHSMHADVAPIVAYSGEFFVQRIPEEISQANGEQDRQSATRDSESLVSPPSDSDPPSPNRDPKVYELVIDNDSGTYRSRPNLLPLLQSWLSAPERLGGLGRIRALPESDQHLQEMKTARKEEKKLRAARGERPEKVAVATKGRSGDARSISSGELGSATRSISSGEVGAFLDTHRTGDAGLDEGYPMVASPAPHEPSSSTADALKNAQAGGQHLPTPPASEDSLSYYASENRDKPTLGTSQASPRLNGNLLT